MNGSGKCNIPIVTVTVANMVFYLEAVLLSITVFSHLMRNHTIHFTSRSLLHSQFSKRYLLQTRTRADIVTPL